MIKRYLSLLALAGLFPITLSAATLQEIYELAVQNDPELAAAQASFKAQSEFITQSRAAFLPSVSMGGSNVQQQIQSTDTRGPPLEPI